MAIVFWADRASAQEEERKSRSLEASFSYEHLSPNAIYGNWYTFNASYYSKNSSDFTYFLQSSLYKRSEGRGATGTIGAYKDWFDSLYTYSSITAGSHSDYLPAFRIDHDFNFKAGKNKNYVLTAGITYIDYFDDHKDLIISGGPTVYLGHFISQYRLFHNESNPGSMGSFSHLVSIGYGEEGRQWTYLNLSFGKQAYLATYLATPQAVNQNSTYLVLKYRHWLDKNYGLFGEASYFNLENGYKKSGTSCGMFYGF
jgi:YaiO family outer membrane protein